MTSKDIKLSLQNPATSFWLKDALAKCDNRDIVDALRDVDILYLFLKEKGKENGIPMPKDNTKQIANLHEAITEWQTLAKSKGEEVIALKEKIIKYEGIMQDNGKTITDLQKKLTQSDDNLNIVRKQFVNATDKLHRRNMQIADLKKNQCPWNIVKDCKKSAV